MLHYFIELSYKGTNYCGWQIQDNAPSVQQELNKALSVLLAENIETTGCGRTDTGVHAKEFFAHFDCNKEIDREVFIYKINKILPLDIAVKNIYPVSPKSHARFDAISRTYEYRIIQNKNPFETENAYYWHNVLDVDLMNEAAIILFDYNDFTCFSKSNTQTFTNDCIIYKAVWEKREHLLTFTISANRFLRNMVRAIVGTMMEVGKRQITLADFRKIIENKNRSQAGLSVPPHGLSLIKVEYPDETLNINNDAGSRKSF